MKVPARCSCCQLFALHSVPRKCYCRNSPESPEDYPLKSQRCVKVIDEFMETGTNLMIVPFLHEGGSPQPDMFQ